MPSTARPSPRRNLRKKHGLNIVTVRRPDQPETGFENADPAYAVAGTPDPTFRLRKGDRLIVFGRLKDIDLFCEVTA
jgi:Trk K+ transport system NAD-binding subunit